MSNTYAIPSIRKPRAPSGLNPREQRIVAEVIAAARFKPGGHVATDRNRCSYWARHLHGRTRWSVIDAYGYVLGSGDCS